MRIKFYAHACFRFQSNGLSLVTDPYEPEASGYDPIEEPADLVLMSSPYDRFHCDPSHVGGDPRVINALDVPAQGLDLLGLDLRTFRAREKLQLGHVIRLRPPRPFAMYSFAMDGVRVLHTGDLSRRIRRSQIELLRGRVDVMMALAGAVHNIEHDDLMAAIEQIEPKVVIPMHYFSPKGTLKILPVDRFAERFAPQRIVHTGSSEIELTAEQLPEHTMLYILEQSR